MKAADVMTRSVIAVAPDTPARKIASLLLQHGISAAPVVDESGAPIGMVSEGDLLPRDESARAARRDWWLRIVAEGEELNPDFVAYVEHSERLAGEIMSRPVITVADQADIVEVAETLIAHRIKRAPVLREGRMVGIVSRADLVKAVAKAGAGNHAPSSDALAKEKVASPELQALAERLRGPSAPPAAPAAAAAEVSARGFQALVDRHEHDEQAHRSEAHRLARDKRRHEVEEMLAANLTEAAWQRMLHDARIAAGKGEKEHMLLRFPVELCSDHGRAVNVPDPSWPETLRGIAAQAYLRWREELRPRGFRLNARVIDFPDGVPGHIGLFLAWGG